MVKYSKLYGKILLKQKRFEIYLKSKGGNYVNGKYLR